MADPSLKHAASLVPVGPFAGKPAMPLTRPVIVVGSGKNARILLKSDTVSTTHTLLIHTSAGWYFRDLVSRTHTILNGKSRREAPVGNGDTLTIGAFVFHFVSVGAAEPTPPPAPAAMEITDAEIPVPIDTRTVLIGRRPGCEVRLIEESVSLVHAVIFEADGVHYLRDLYSRSGTFLNGQKIHEEPLKFGDVIVVGETTIKYIPDRLAETTPDLGAPEPAEAPPALRPATPIAAAISLAELPDRLTPTEPALDIEVEAPVVPIARREARSESPTEPEAPAEIDARMPADPAVANQPLSIVEPSAEPVEQRVAEALPLDATPAPDLAGEPADEQVDEPADEPPAPAPVETAGPAELPPEVPTLAVVEPVDEQGAIVADVLADACQEESPADDLHDDDHHAAEPPLIAPTSEELVANGIDVPADMTELAALQARIRAALSDPTTILKEPLLSEEGSVLPPVPLSDSARRARMIAELLENTEEIEEEAEREASAIPFDAPADLEAELPPLEPVVEPEPIEVADIAPEPAEPAEEPERVPDALPESAVESVAEPAVESTAEPTVESAVESVTESIAESTPASLDAGEEVESSAPLAEIAAPVFDVEPPAEAALPVESIAVVPPIAFEPAALSDAPVDAAPLTFDEPAPLPAATVADVVETPIELPEPPTPADVVTADDVVAVNDVTATAGHDLDTIADEAAIAEAPTIDLGMDDAVAPPIAGPADVEPAASIGSASLSLAAGEAAVIGDDELVAELAPRIEDLVAEPFPHLPSAEEGDALAPPSIESTEAGEPRAESSAAEAGPLAAETDDALVVPRADPVEQAWTIESPDVLAESAAVEEPPSTKRKGRKSAAPKSPRAGRTRKSPRAIAEETKAEIAAENQAAAAFEPDVSEDIGADIGAVIGPIAEVVPPPAAEVHVEPVDAEVAPTTLDEIAAHEAAPEASLPVDEVIVPSRVALEPDELPVEQPEAVAPIELDDPNAGEVIATRPTTLDEIEIEQVSPMFDPDPGAIVERDALDGIDAVLAEDAAIVSAETLSADDAGAVLVVDEDDEAGVASEPRPLAAAPVVEDEEEEPLDLTADAPQADGVVHAGEAGGPIELIPSASADAVASSFVVERETPADEIAVPVDDGPAAVFEFVPAAAKADGSALDLTAAAEAPGVAESLLDDVSPIAPAEFAVEGASLDAASIASELAPPLEPASESPTETLEVVADGVAEPAVLAFDVPADAAAAPETIVDEPAPLDGSTLIADGEPFDTAQENRSADTRADERADEWPSSDAKEAGPSLRIAPADDSPDVPDRVEESWTPRDDAPRREGPGVRFVPHGAAPAGDEEQTPVPAEAIVSRAPKPTSIVNVKMPSLEEVEASFRDAFAEAVAMAAKAQATTDAPSGTMESKSDAPGEVFGDAPADERGDARGDVPAPVAPPVARAAPKWELDESLLEQAGRADGAGEPLGGAMGASAGFMSLGGIGWIGDDATDQYEQVPTQLSPSAFPRGLQPLRGGLGGPPRQSRKRRPVSGQTPAASATPAESVDPAVESTAEWTPQSTSESTSDSRWPALSAESADRETFEPVAPETPTPADDIGLDLAGVDVSDAETESAATESADVAEPTDEPDVTTLPTADIDEEADAATATLPPPMMLPPRPIRRARPQAGVADSFEPAGAPASPFAEQALPLIDAFSQAPTTGLDEMLARLGAAEGQIRDTPPITQDRPAGPAPAPPTPFASHVPIQSAASPGVRRTRQQVSRLPLLMMLMVGFMGLAALGAWYYPVSTTIVGEVAFQNMGKLDALSRGTLQDQLREKLGKARQPARRLLDDRYGNGFLDSRERFASVVDTVRFEERGDKVIAMVLEYPSTVNQKAGDIERMNALLAQTQIDNKDLVEAQKRKADALKANDSARMTAATAKKKLEEDRDAAIAVGQTNPERSEINKVENDVRSLEEARKEAARRLDAAEAQRRRLEASALLPVPAARPALEGDVAFAPHGFAPDDDVFALMFASVDDGLVAAPAAGPAEKDWKAERDRLIGERDEAAARLEQLTQAQSPEARQARERFDQSLAAFADAVDAAGKSLGDDRPEVLQYVDSARRLQEQIRAMTDTLVRRQQQQLTRMAEFKQKLAELNEANQEQRFAGDPQLKEWSDRLAIQERLLNTARADNATETAVAELEAQVSLLRNMIAGQREMLSDPRARQVVAQLEEMIQTTQRDMAADRDANDKLLADIQETFHRQQPAVEKLPDDQKQLAQTLASKLAQIDLARQRYTNSLAQSAGGEALQISELKTKIATLEPLIAQATAQADADAIAEAAEMQRRAETAAMIEKARTAVAEAQTTLDEAESRYEARRKKLELLRHDTEVARQARERADELTTEILRVEESIKRLIVQGDALSQELASAVVPKPAAEQRKAYALDAKGTDPRLVAGASSIGVIGLIFGFLIFREMRGRVPTASVPDSHHGSIPSGARTA